MMWPTRLLLVALSASLLLLLLLLLAVTSYNDSTNDNNQQQQPISIGRQELLFELLPCNLVPDIFGGGGGGGSSNDDEEEDEEEEEEEATNDDMNDDNITLQPSMSPTPGPTELQVCTQGEVVLTNGTTTMLSTLNSGASQNFCLATYDIVETIVSCRVTAATGLAGLNMWLFLDDETDAICEVANTADQRMVCTVDTTTTSEQLVARIRKTGAGAATDVNIVCQVDGQADCLVPSEEWALDISTPTVDLVAFDSVSYCWSIPSNADASVRCTTSATSGSVTLSVKYADIGDATPEPTSGSSSSDGLDETVTISGSVGTLVEARAVAGVNGVENLEMTCSIV